MFDVRVRAYAPAGAPLGLLPTPQGLEVSFPHNDVGALSLTYSSLAVAGPIVERGLEQGIELAVEISSGAGWVEPAGGRFVTLGRQRDRADETRTITLTAPSWAWLLTKFRNLATANLLPLEHSQAGKRPFYSATAGTILATLLQEATTRSGLPMTRPFTTGQDSAGVSWSQVVTIFYDLGLDLWAVLDNLTQQGVCDWRTQARALQVYNPDTACARDLAEQVRLHLGRDLADAPESETLEDVVAKVLIRGEEGLLLTESNPSAPTPWGQWEGYISQSGVSDEGTARTLVQADLARGARVRGQYTRQLVISDRTRHLPMVDYLPGDWITAPTTGSPETVRLQQVTLTRDSDGVVAGNVILNDRLVDAELRRAKRMKGIVGGTSATSGTGRPVTDDGPDRRTPAAPIGLVVGSNAYLDPDGAARGRITAAWAPVTTATDGTAVEIDVYELWGRPNVLGAPWTMLTTSDTEDATLFGFDVGSSWQFRVRAIGTYTLYPSAASATVTHTIASDTTPPPTPSHPSLSTRLGTVTVRWDGKTSTGAAMPADFSHLDVEADGTIAGALHGSSDADLLVLADRAYAVSVAVRFRAVDRSGNLSPWSATTFIAPVRATGPDFEANSVTTNALAAGAVTTVKLDANAVTADKIAAGAVTADKIDALAIRADKVAVGVMGMNLLPNSGFEDTGIWPPPTGMTTPPNMTGWVALERSAGRNDTWRFNAGGNCRSGWGYGLVWSGTTANNGTEMRSPWVEVIPGQQYRLGVWMRNPHAQCTLTLGVYTATAVGGALTWQGGVVTGNPAVGGTHTEISGTWTCPAGVNAIRLGFINVSVAPHATGRAVAIDDAYVIAVGAPVTELTPGSLRMWDSNGNLTIDLHGDSGRILGKSILTALTGKRVTMEPSVDGSAFLAYDSADRRRAWFAVPGSVDYPLLAFWDSSGNQRLTIRQDNITDHGNDLSIGGPVNITGNIAVNGTTVITSARVVNAAQVQVGGTTVVNASRNVTAAMSTTTSSANVNSASNASALARVSSLRRLKHLREPIGVEYAVLDLPAMTWLEQHDEDPEPQPGRIAGFVAEDVSAVSAFHGGVLDPLLVLDDDGDLQGLAYDRITAYLIPILRDINDRLAILEGA